MTNMQPDNPALHPEEEFDESLIGDPVNDVDTSDIDFSALAFPDEVL